MTTRTFFSIAVAAALVAGNALSQAAPAPAPARSSTSPAGDQTRWQRVADDLRRAGDDKLADELMRAWRRLSRDTRARAGAPPTQATDQTAEPPASSRRGRVSTSPAPAGIPGLTLARDGRALTVAPSVPAVPQAPVFTPMPDALKTMTTPHPPGMAGVAPGQPAPGATQHHHTHRHEVHHYFHGTPPAGVGAMGGRAAPAPSPVQPRARLANPSAPSASARPSVGQDPSAGQVRRAPAAGARPPAASPTPRAPVAAPAPVAPPAPRGAAPRTSNERRARVVNPPAAQPQPGRAPTPAAQPRVNLLRRASPGGDASLDVEVDGLRREVEELRGLLQRLREQIRQRSPH